MNTTEIRPISEDYYRRQIQALYQIYLEAEVCGDTATAERIKLEMSRLFGLAYPQY